MIELSFPQGCHLGVNRKHSDDYRHAGDFIDADSFLLGRYVYFILDMDSKDSVQRCFFRFEEVVTP